MRGINLRLYFSSSFGNYDKFLISYLKEEDPLDAIKRSIETTIELAQHENIQNKDVLRYGNKNKICYNIINGKLQSASNGETFESRNPALLVDCLGEFPLSTKEDVHQGKLALGCDVLCANCGSVSDL